MVAEHAAGRWTTLLPAETGDQLAIAVSVLDLLDRLHLGPATDPEVVASSLDEVALACSPFRDLATNPAKILAIEIADANPLLWGGSVLAARAARRVAESIRRATGRAALAADAEHLLPVLEATGPADVFADPFADPPTDAAVEVRPVLVVLDDGSQEPLVVATRERLEQTAREHDVHVHTVATNGEGEVAGYAAMLLTGLYAAAYLQIGSFGG